MPGRSRITVVALLACAGALTACKSGGKAARSDRDDAPLRKAVSEMAAADTRRADLPPADEAAEDLRKYIDQIDPIAGIGQIPDDTLSPETLDLESAIANAGKAGTPKPGRQVMEAPPQILSAPSIDDVDPPSGPPDDSPGVPSNAPAPSDEPPEDEADAPESPSETPEARLARQLAEIQQTIADLHANNASQLSGGADRGMDLLALSLLRNDAADAELDALKSTLSPTQRRTLSTLEHLLTEVRGDDEAGRLTALDARRVSRLLSEHAEKLADARPLRISSAALCTSVQSFGVYTRFNDYTFLQGRVQPVIVYVGLENFGQRPLGAATSPEASFAGAPFNAPSAEERQKKEAWEQRAGNNKNPAPFRNADGWATRDPDMVVQLTQSIAIHTDADDLVVWRAPEASIRDVSRERRQDYYLVQRVDLPARLTLGKYNMKITVRDAATGATDESVIPIEIVADPALARGR